MLRMMMKLLLSTSTNMEGTMTEQEQESNLEKNTNELLVEKIIRTTRKLRTMPMRQRQL